MSIGDDHHYFPKKFLKIFFGREGGIHFLDKETKKITCNRNVKSIAKVKHLYSVDISGANQKDKRLEAHFAKMEEVYFSSLERMVGDVRGCGDEDVLASAQLSIFLWSRTEEIVQLAESSLRKGSVKNVLEEIEIKNNLKNGSADDFYNFLIENEGAAYFHAFDKIFNGRLKKASENFDIELLIAEDKGIGFVLGSSYGGIRVLSENNSMTHKSIFESSVSILCPIHKSMCFHFYPKKNDSELLEIKRVKVFCETIMDINNVLALGNSRYVFSDDEAELKRAQRNINFNALH